MVQDFENMQIHPSAIVSNKAKIGENTKIDSISITWPGGKTQSLADIAANQLLEVDEIDEINYSFWDRFLKYFNID